DPPAIAIVGGLVRPLFTERRSDFFAHDAPDALFDRHRSLQGGTGATRPSLGTAPEPPFLRSALSILWEFLGAGMGRRMPPRILRRSLSAGRRPPESLRFSVRATRRDASPNEPPRRAAPAAHAFGGGIRRG